MYACHTRNKEVEAVEAVEETVQVARDSGVRCQVSHIIPRRGGPADARERAIGAVEKGHDEGLDVAFDAHTRLHGITNLSAALPSPFLEKSTADRASGTALPTTTFRRHVREYPSLISSFALGGWENVYLFRSATSPEIAVGKSIADLTGEEGKTVGTPSWTSSPAKSSRSSTRWSSATPTPRKSFATPSSIRCVP